MNVALGVKNNYNPNRPRLCLNKACEPPSPGAEIWCKICRVYVGAHPLWKFFAVINLMKGGGCVLLSCAQICFEDKTLLRYILSRYISSRFSCPFSVHHLPFTLCLHVDPLTPPSPGWGASWWGALASKKSTIQSSYSSHHKLLLVVLLLHPYTMDCILNLSYFVATILAVRSGTACCCVTLKLHNRLLGTTRIQGREWLESPYSSGRPSHVHLELPGAPGRMRHIFSKSAAESGWVVAGTCFRFIWNPRAFLLWVPKNANTLLLKKNHVRAIDSGVFSFQIKKCG